QIQPSEATLAAIGALQIQPSEATLAAIGALQIQPSEATLAALNAIGAMQIDATAATRNILDAVSLNVSAVTRAALGAVNLDALGNVDLNNLRAGLLDFAEVFRRVDPNDPNFFYPPNWPRDPDLARVNDVISDDGIPLVWVPRQAVVEQVLQAPDRSARIAVLLEHADELAEDCRLVLTDIFDPSLAGQLPLARRAVEAFADGHRETAMALATVVTETVIADALSRKYDDVKKEVAFDAETVPLHRLSVAAALGPIHRFYTAWFKSWGTPPPEALSRHVSVHNADVGHYTDGNALVAILLVSSVLRGIQEMQEGGLADEAA
uniref:hypothetical protein n=1 Tax=uncultured Modestobacter sp. TaxID=380048 RepID=UPI0026100A64